MAISVPFNVTWLKVEIFVRRLSDVRELFFKNAPARALAPSSSIMFPPIDEVMIHELWQKSGRT